MTAKLEYWDESNKTIVSESGFRYVDTSSIFKHHEEIEGLNHIELFEKFYKLNNRLRYCSGSYYKWNDKDLEFKYNEWLKSDYYKKKSFNLYYGNGVVD